MFKQTLSILALSLFILVDNSAQAAVRLQALDPKKTQISKAFDNNKQYTCGSYRNKFYPAQFDKKLKKHVLVRSYVSYYKKLAARASVSKKTQLLKQSNNFAKKNKIQAKACAALKVLEDKNPAIPLNPIVNPIRLIDDSTPTPTATSTATATQTKTATPSKTATSTKTATATPTKTPTATHTAVGTSTATPTKTATATPTKTATQTPTRTATATRTSTPTPTKTATPTATNTPPSTTKTSELEIGIANPIRNGLLSAPANVLVKVLARDADMDPVKDAGSSLNVGKVTLTITKSNGAAVLTKVINNAPYLYAWTDIPPADYLLTATATSKTGKLVTAPVINFKVVSPLVGKTIFVSKTGSDSASGDASNPLASIQAAVNKSISGDTIKVLPGTYYESIYVASTNTGTELAPVTIEGISNNSGSVIVSGADEGSANGWKPLTGHAGIFYKDLSYSQPYFYSSNPPDSAGSPPENPMTRRLEQVIWDGLPLRNRATFEELSPGSFYFDSTYTTPATRLYVQLPGNIVPDVRIKVTRRKDLLVAGTNARFVTVRNITFTSAQNAYQGANAAVRVGDNWTLDNVTVQYANGTGIGIVAKDVTLKGTIVQNNGQLGYNAGGCTNLMILDGVSRSNNYRLLKVGWEAGGSKFAHCDGVLISNFQGYNNVGPAIWFDMYRNRNYAVEGGFVHSNVGRSDKDEGSGVFFEIAPYGPGKVEGIVAANNTGAGILLSESRYVTVTNNTLVNNSKAILMRDNNRGVSDCASDFLYCPMQHIKIYNNLFKRNRHGTITTAQSTPAVAGKDWDSSAPTRKDILINANKYELITGDTQGNRLMKWGSEYRDIAVLRNERVCSTAACGFGLPYERDGSVGVITLPTSVNQQIAALNSNLRSMTGQETISIAPATNGKVVFVAPPQGHTSWGQSSYLENLSKIIPPTTNILQSLSVFNRSSIRQIGTDRYSVYFSDMLDFYLEAQINGAQKSWLEANMPQVDTREGGNGRPIFRNYPPIKLSRSVTGTNGQINVLLTCLGLDQAGTPVCSDIQY